MIVTMPFQFSVFPKLAPAKETVDDHLPDVVHGPLVVPFIFQGFHILDAESTFIPRVYILGVGTLDVLIQHRFEMKYFTAVLATHW